MLHPELTRYQVQDLIGEGGMGKVYLALDRRLERQVALKIIPQDILADEATRKRFRKEALTLSRLNHPNIATIYDFDTEDGVDFLAMEYVPGQTLDDRLREGPLTEDEVHELGSQLAAGLAAAHDQSVIHRDLKPGNLRVTPDGRLKILDFGIAKYAHSHDATVFTKTEDEGVSGTLPYMAPEQLKGDAVDARTDLHAAGAVLYEMATGRRPFDGDYPAALMYAIMNEAPPSPCTVKTDMDAPLESVILKALAKEPESRYQNARELAEALETSRRGIAVEVPRRRSPATRRRWLLGAGVAFVLAVAALIGGIGKGLLDSRTSAPAIAVLPCVNVGGDVKDAYFADGMTDDLITQLLQFKDFARVINTTTMLSYRDTEKTPREIAEELGVGAVLSSRLSLEGDVIHLSAQLIDPHTDEVLWGERYTRDTRDVYGLQSEIAHLVAQSLGVAVAGQEGTQDIAESVDPEAYRLLKKGQEMRRSAGVTGQGWKETEERALAYFQQAAQLDSTFALAFMELSEVAWRLAGSGMLPVAREKAEEIRQRYLALADSTRARALALNPGLDQLYPRNGVWDEEAFRKALAIRPNDAWAYYWHANWLRVNGRFAESQTMHERALDLDPGNLRFRTVYAQIFYYQREFQKSEQLCREILDVYPGEFNALHYLWWSLMEQGRYLEAGEVMLQFLALRFPDLANALDPFDLLIRNMAGTVPVDATTWQIVDGIDQKFGGQAAAYFAVHLGNRERTMRYLTSAWSGPDPRDWQNFPVGPQALLNPTWDTVRSAPGFASLEQNVLTAWKNRQEHWK